MAPRPKPTVRRRLLLAAGSTVAALVLGEVGLRLAGVTPGGVRAFTNVKYVDELVVLDQYETDGEGVFKANPAYPWPEDVRINSDGFRSPPFVPDESEQTSLLFLGDSFTWGATALPPDRCFVDRIRDQGFVCHNTGIPGTDPGQYAALAEKWAPRLRPDIVVAMLYMGNDLTEWHPRQPSGQLYWVTNAGWLLGYDGNGNYFQSAQASYDYYIRRKDVAQSRTGPVRSLLAATALGSHALAILEGCDVAPKSLDPAALRSGLERMRRAAEQVGARFELVLIPVRPALRRAPAFDIERNRDLFDGFDPHVPVGLDASHYMPSPNDHLNTDGHGRLAEFIMRALGLK